MRDDFSEATKAMLAKRVGMRCSNPSCPKVTSGPQDAPNKAVNIGVAAHITAAAPSGPRYDSALSTEERKSIENGIWLCQNCAKMIDSDPTRFTVGVLDKWKAETEEVARRAIEGCPVPEKTPANDEALWAKLYRLMPGLLNEMKRDLSKQRTSREFLLTDSKLAGYRIYREAGKKLLYYWGPNVADHVKILEGHQLVKDITDKQLLNPNPRYTMTERFVDMLMSHALTRLVFRNLKDFHAWNKDVEHHLGIPRYGRNAASGEIAYDKCRTEGFARPIPHPDEPDTRIACAFTRSWGGIPLASFLDEEAQEKYGFRMWTEEEFMEMGFYRDERL